MSAEAVAEDVLVCGRRFGAAECPHSSPGTLGHGLESFGAMTGFGVFGTLRWARAEALHSCVNQTAAVERREEREAVHRTRAGARKSQGPLIFGPCTGGEGREEKPRTSWAIDNTEGGPPSGLPRF